MNNTIPPKMEEIFTRTWSMATAAPLVGEQDYLPLKVDDLTCDVSLGFDLFMRIRMAGGNEAEMVIVCPRETPLPAELKKKIEQAGISLVYFHRRDLTQVLSYLNDRLGEVLQEDSLTPVQKAQTVARVTVLWVRHFFTDASMQQEAYQRIGFQYVDHLFGFLCRDSFHRAALTDLYQHEPNIYAHCLNCSLLSMAFAQYLGWPENKIKDLGGGALLHDIGLTRVPQEILSKMDMLSDEEWALITRHPSTGYGILKNFASETLGVLSIVLQHHENCDGSGYPEGLKLTQIHPMARVMRIVDSFEAMISQRHWRAAFNPAHALQIMTRECKESNIFDKKLLISFIKFLSS